MEGLMLKLKFQYFSHLMRRTDSFEKTLILGKIEGRRRRGRWKMRQLNGITNGPSPAWITLPSSRPRFPNLPHSLPSRVSVGGIGGLPAQGATSLWTRPSQNTCHIALSVYFRGSVPRPWAMSWAPMHTFLCRQCQAWGSSSGAQIDGSNYGGLTPVPTSTSLPLNNLRVFFLNFWFIYLFMAALSSLLQELFS